MPNNPDIDFVEYEEPAPKLLAVRITKITMDLIQTFNNEEFLTHPIAQLTFYKSTRNTDEPDIYLYGTRGPQVLSVGDWIVLHPDSRNYIVTDLQFQRRYSKVLIK